MSRFSKLMISRLGRLLGGALVLGMVTGPASAQSLLPYLAFAPETCCSYSVDVPASGPPTVTVTAVQGPQATVLIANISVSSGRDPAPLPNNGNSTLNLSIGGGPYTVSSQQYAFGVFGQASIDSYNAGSGANQSTWTIGPTLNITNTANMSLSSPTPVNLAAPFVSLSTSAALLAESNGANGYFQEANHTPAGSSVYNGANGGPISIASSGTFTVTAGGVGSGSGGPWQPHASAIAAYSAGGVGVGGKTNDNDIAGNGGTGGAISITTNPGLQISLQGGGAPGATLNGITAYSQGGGSGCDCSGDVANLHGNSGAGGAVTVAHNNGSIGSSAAYSIGISAVSIGGDGGLSTGHGVGTNPGTSGAGGQVSVTLGSGASIALNGGNSIGVLAASAVGPSAQSNTSNSGGAVSVTIDQSASITATGGGAFNIGVVAVSTGSPDILQPFATNVVSANGSGLSGSVTVANGGSISSNGQLAIGIAALSIGGSGVFTGASGSTANALGNLGAFNNGGGVVQVTNTGSIATNGGSAFGILGASNGAGGLVNLASNLLSNGSGSYSLSNVNLIGAQSATNNGDGGEVSVGNSGSITTGDGSGGGKLAIGILAQSIGGGGGSSGGSGIATHVGDAGGNGGNGGLVRVGNSGTIATKDDGAIGILAQSVGGGGGNGGNETGIFVATGGFGGSGGYGNTVEVTLQSGSSIATSGDYASGLVAQSIGGGGGNGGYGKSVGAFVSAAIGGAGGSGGKGGDLTITNNSTITSMGGQSHGILAQSVGGGGGNGGAANSYQIGVVFSAGIAVGGSGGVAGDGGTVTLYNGYHITTLGTDSIGIVAQSIGGGGGNGGSALSKSLAVAGDPEIPTISLDVTLGGSGGTSGAGGAVTVTSIGIISTTGDGSHGILVQSIGGGGGNGGDSTATALAIEGKSPTFKAAVALGGSGGASGDGGTVILSSNSCTGCVNLITTIGNNAAGMVAQSIGGGGGNGGAGSASTSSPNLGADTGNGLSMTYGMGGSGGASGTGGSVTVTNGLAATITTVGSGSQGILAQSIGGGGGNGGGGSADGSGDTLNINVAVGKAGGGGSNGGAVTVTNAGSISTGKVLTANDGLVVVTGGDSVGILAQSIGGGGGTGGGSDAAATIGPLSQLEDALNKPSDSYSANISIGRGGGAGGAGGAVSAINSGTIVTRGIRAYGVLAQSIGGGGGSGGAANAAANSVLGGGDIKTEDGKVSPIGNTYSATVSVGGGGGIGGAGGTVGVTNSGTILTAGYGAHAIMAQSIGGGGGVGAEGTVNNTTTIGIGGGFSGSGASAGAGSTVTIGSAGGLVTLGDDSYAILAQSIGGSGGAAGAGCSNSNAASFQGFSASRCLGNGNVGLSGNTSSWNDSSDYSFTVGGTAGSSGDGGAVTINIDGGSILTTGARSIAIVAQSIGGGGGLIAANALNTSQTTLRGQTEANAGGEVSVTLGSGAGISTSGAGAWGILAQSVGGGGGFVGDSSLNMSAPQNGAASGSSASRGGAVQVTVNGTIQTTGTNAHGVVAQSVGGGGGLAGGGGQGRDAVLEAIGNSGASNAQGTGGQVIVNQGSASRIVTAGVGSIGIFAQSAGVAATPPIAVTVSGAVIGGTNNGYDFTNGGIGAAGIVLSSNGAGNTVTVNAGGLVSTMDGVDGTAIMARQTVTSLQNAGTVTGKIDAAGGTMTNSGVFNSGSTVNLTSLSNTGTLNVFGPGRAGTTTVNGNFTQSSTGNLVVEVNPQTGAGDLLNVTGTATLAGQVTPVPLALLPGSAQVISAAGGITGNVTVASSLLFRWSGAFTGTGGVNTGFSVTATPNFSPGGVSLTGSQQSLANTLASAWSNADPAYARQFAYLARINSPSAYAAVLEALSPKATQAQLSAMFNSAGTMLGASMSCPVFVEQSVLLGEDNCVWAKVTGQRTTQGASGDSQGSQVSGVTYRIGAQHAIASNWYLGGSLGISQTWATMDGGSTSSGQIFDGSVSLKHTMGPWLFAGSIVLASGTFHSNRVVSLPGGGGLAPVNTTMQADQSLFMAGGRLRAAYEFTFDSWYLRPYGDLDVVHTNAPAFRESGQSDFALNVYGSSKTSIALSPMVEFGGRLPVDGNLILRPFLAIGARFVPDNVRHVDASLVGALPATGTFRTTYDSPGVLGSVDVGLQLYRAGGFELRAEYGLKAGGSYLSQTAGGRMAFHF
jgi:uncharacterized protein YhjY with autotransporter beta-barrel domain